MKNHFHLFIRTRTEENIRLANLGRVQNPAEVKPVEKIITNQFSKFFNGYAQAFNKQQNRTGGLFEEPFRRIEIDSDSYFTQLIYYIHVNPQKHGLIDDFAEYEFSSYKSILSSQPTKLERQAILDWFGSADEYYKFHKEGQNLMAIEKFMLEL